MRRHTLPCRIGVVAGVLCASLIGMALSSCATGPGDTVPFATAAKTQLERLPGVASVSVSQSPLDASTSESADPAKPELWNVAIDVRMLGAATAKQVAVAATSTRTFSESHATRAPWTASILAGGDATPYSGDTSPLPAIQVQVFPTKAKALSAARTARAALAVKEVPGVNRITVAGSFAYVETLDAAQLTAVYDAVRHLTLFEHGGSYSTSDGRVRIVDVPSRVGAASIHAIIDLGTRYPGAKIALEAPTQGPQYPELYLDHVSLSEAGTIAATLSSLDHAAVTTGNYALPFHIRAMGGDTTTDTSGYLGSKPS
jgi:hypothetical protein